MLLELSPSRRRSRWRVTLAWLTERTDLPLARLWSWLAVVPLAIPAFVHSYAWDGLFPWLRGLWPAVAISVLAYFPFVYLPVVAQLRRLDPAVEDVAASLGEPPARVFLRVVLPQLRLAIAGGALLIALHLLAEYGLFVLIRFDTLTTAIVDQFQAVYDGPAANLLGIVLVACARSASSASRPGSAATAATRAIGSGAARVAPRTRARPRLAALDARARSRSPRSRWRCRWRRSCAGSGAAARPPGTGRARRRRSGRPRSTPSPGRRSPASPPCRWPGCRPGRRAGCSAASRPATSTSARCRASSSRWRWWRSPCGSRCRSTRPSRRCSPPMSCSSSPARIVALRASLAQVPVELEQAAIALGRPPLAAAVGTTLRLAAPGIAAGMALVAMGITTELTATLMLSPIGTRTLATEFWALTAEFDHVGAAPYALAMILLSLPLCVILYRQALGAIGR